MYGGGVRYLQDFGGVNLKRDRLRDLGVDGRVMLK